MPCPFLSYTGICLLGLDRIQTLTAVGFTTELLTPGLSQTVGGHCQKTGRQIQKKSGFGEGKGARNEPGHSALINSTGVAWGSYGES